MQIIVESAPVVMTGFVRHSYAGVLSASSRALSLLRSCILLLVLPCEAVRLLFDNPVLGYMNRAQLQVLPFLFNFLVRCSFIFPCAIK